MKDRSILMLYSLTHFWVDLSCAFLVFRVLAGAGDLALCLLLYNFCAFAMQMPLGLLADRLDRNGQVAAVGCGLTALAYLMPGDIFVAVTAGLGNALFHLGGGIDILNWSRKRSAALGIFVSPGALGLYIGTIWGRGGAVPLWLGPAGLLLLGTGILSLCGRKASGNVPLSLPGIQELKPLISFFAVVVLRSYMGMNQAFDWKGEGAWGLLLVFSLVLGKTAGGFLADRMGPRRASAWSLTLAAGLYLLSGLPLPGTLAVFLFNMTMPVTLWAAAKVLPGAKGFAFGTLTFGLFLGYLPSFLGWPSVLVGEWAYTAVALLSLALLWRPLRGEVVGVLTILAVSLTLTLLLELGFALAWGLRGRRELTIVALVNLLTNPAAVLAYHTTVGLWGWSPVPVTIVLEMVAVLVEWLCYRECSEQIKRPFLFALLANGFSYSIGYIIKLL